MSTEAIRGARVEEGLGPERELAVGLAAGQVGDFLPETFVLGGEEREGFDAERSGDVLADELVEGLPGEALDELTGPVDVGAVVPGLCEAVLAGSGECREAARGLPLRAGIAAGM